jgi:NAD(P)-dependent dehydrogenase (short-subunit alcohol dehydrogenase family)
VRGRPAWVTLRSHAEAALATGGVTTPREVATIVTVLASPCAGNVTGSNWIVDGGLIETM